MPLYQEKTTEKVYNAMPALVHKYEVTVARHTVEKLDKGYRVDAHADGRKLRALEAAGYKVDRYEDVDKEGKKRQKEVRKVTKKAVAAEALAVASSAHYLNVVEVEKALAVIGDPPNDPFTKLIKLPNRTWEKRVCNALKIGKGSGR